MTDRKLSSIKQFSNPDSRSFTVKNREGTKLEIFVVSKNGHLTAWLNQCPHKGMPLEWQPDEFLDDDGENIICATHGALFDIEDGSCLGGPCRGQGLTLIPIEKKGDDLYLTEESGLEVFEV